MSTTKDLNRKRPRSSSKPKTKGDAAKGPKNDSKKNLLQAIEPLRPLLNMIKDAIIISDMEANIVEVNDAALQISRCTREEFVGRNSIEIIAEKDRPAAIESIMKQMEGASPDMTECTFVAPDGRELEVEFTSSFVRDSTGNILGTITICRDITERKRMADDLEKAAKKLRIIIESIGDILIITDMDLNIVNVNEAALRALGYSSEEELIGKSATVPIAEKDRARVTVYMGKALAGKEGGNIIEYTLAASDGKEFTVEANTEILRDCAGKLVGLIITARDITERKRMQETLLASEEKLRVMFDAITDGIVVIDMEGRIIDLNEAAFRMSGLSGKEELIDTNALDVLAEEDQERAATDMMKAISEGTAASSLVYTLTRKDGSTFTCEFSTAILKDNSGNPSGFIAVERDITERKQMEAELEKSAEKLRTVIESIGDMLFITDMDLNLTNVNEAAARLLGYDDREKLIGKNAMDAVAAKDRARIAVDMAKALTGQNGSEIMEYTLVSADGTEFDVESNTEILNDCSGQTVGLIMTSRDVTERKRMQEAVRASEEKMRVMFNSINDGIIITDMLGNIVEGNEAACRMAHYDSMEEIMGINPIEFIVEKDKPKLIEDMTKLLETGEAASDDLQYTMMTKDGEEFDAELSVSTLLDDSGNATGFVAVERNVTERKRMQEAVRASAEKLNTVLESMSDGVIVLDMFGNITEANDTAVHMLEYGNKEDLIGKSAMDTIAEQDRQKCADAISQSLEAGETPGALEFVMITATGREFDSELATSMLHDDHGNLTGFVGVIRDVTERKRIQEELRKTAEKLRIMFETIGDMFILTDMELNIVNVNEAAARLLGYRNEEELAGKSITELIVEGERDPALKAMNKTLKTKKGSGTTTVECKFLSADGKEFNVEATTDLLRDCSGKPSGLIVTARDVTERKQMQEELHKTVDKLNILFESIADGIVVSDMNGTIIEANEAAVRIAGFGSKDEVLNKNGLDFIAAEDQERVTNDLAKALFEGSPISISQYSIDAADGRKIDLEVHTSMMRDSGNNPVGFIVVERDITERKHMLKVLRDSEEKKRLIFESLKEMIMVVDLKGNVVEANNSSLNLLGYTKEELMGMSTLEFVAEKDREGAIESAIKLVSVGVADDYIDYTTLALVNKDGEEVEVEYSTALMRDSVGKPTAVIGIAHDISERRRMEKEMIESAEKLKSMFESIKDPVIVSDMAGNILEVNDAALRISGWPRERWVGTNALEVVHEKDRQAVVESLMKQMEEGPSEELTECTFVVGDGRELEVDFSSSMIHDGSGQPIGTVTVARDITERKRAEMAIRESEEKLRAIFNSVRDGILVIDLEGNFKEFNEATMSMTGYSREELAGKSAFEFILEEDREKVIQDMSTTLTDKHTQALTSYRLLAKGNKVFDAELSSGMLLDSEGNPTALIGVMRDVTDRKQIEDKLVKTKENLERSNRELEQFAYVASHDLQEPLRMVSSYLKLLERRSKDKLDAEAQEFIDFAVDGSTRMAAMIQALLTYSRVGTRGKPFEPTDCEDIFKKAVTNLLVAIEEKDAVVTHDPLPTILADGTQMLQLFQNLIGNGLKFQDNKRPEVHVSVEDKGTNWGFFVRDNGIGIDPKYKDRIFVIFERLHGKGDYKGTGIGLAVCKKIVERHGGQIWVDSTPGEGATFSFTLPKERKESDNA